MMPQGDLVALKAVGEIKQAFSPFPGAKKTGVFPILRAVRPPPDIGELDVVGESFCFKKIPQEVGLPGIKAKVDVNRHDFIMDGDAFASLME